MELWACAFRLNQQQKSKIFQGQALTTLKQLKWAIAHPSSSLNTSTSPTTQKLNIPKVSRVQDHRCQVLQKYSKSQILYHFPHLDEVQEKEFGKSRVSRYKNVSIASFGREKKSPGIDKWKLKVPGFKYNVFSEFGSSIK